MGRQQHMAQGRVAVLLPGDSACAPVAAEGHGADLGTWTYINIAVIAVFDLFVLWAFGPNALLYLFFSFWFSVGGLHPLSARWLQEHFAFGPDQGTFDYYGPLNTLALNIGYHNEHHDFHEIPWKRLPELKAMAPEFYDRSALPSLLDGAARHLHLRSDLFARHALGQCGRTAAERVAPVVAPAE